MFTRVINKIGEILYEWVTQSYVFSSADVIQYLRDNRITSLPNFYLKRVINGKLRNVSTYTSTLVEYAGMNYHVFTPSDGTSFAYQYTPLTRDLLVGLELESVPETSREIVPRTPVEQLRVIADKYDRLVIPKRVLSYAGFVPEQTVYVKKDVETNRVIVSTEREDSTFKKRSVTKRGMIRILASPLDAEQAYTAKADLATNRIYLVA